MMSDSTLVLGIPGGTVCLSISQDGHLLRHIVTTTEGYATYIQSVAKSLLDRCAECFRENRERLVRLHGTLWQEELLLKYASWSNPVFWLCSEAGSFWILARDEDAKVHYLALDWLFPTVEERDAGLPADLRYQAATAFALSHYAREFSEGVRLAPPLEASWVSPEALSGAIAFERDCPMPLLKTLDPPEHLGNYIGRC